MTVRDLIKLHEGVKPYPYRCSAGKLSIGVGRNLDDKGLRVDEIEYLLGNDLKEAWDEAAKYPWFLALSDARKAAILDLQFNLGASTFAKFKKFIAAMALKDYEAAAKELEASAWYGQVGKRAINVINLIKYEVWP